MNRMASALPPSEPVGPHDDAARDVTLGMVARALSWRTPAGRTLRRALGSFLAVAIILTVFHTAGVLRPDRHALGGIVLVVAVLVVVVGPWFLRLARSLSFERAARIREQERAEVAAHLHDSVLQTLALIQTRAGETREVAALARRQERELRRWLFERPRADAGDSLRAAMERVAVEVEERHRMPIETVFVGDCQLDAPLEALVQAAREALTNAAKFAGSEHVDLFCEVRPGRVEVFVRDRGLGFDPDAIAPDRRGVRDSIIGRVTRYGGLASVHSAPGEGTEVELVVELPDARTASVS